MSPPLRHCKIAAAPYVSLTLLRWLAIESKASSHDMRSKLPRPRSPTRLIGYFSRKGLWTLCRRARHRAQARNCGALPSSVSTLVITPSLVCTFSKQIPPQWGLHTVAITFSSDLIRVPDTSLMKESNSRPVIS